MKELAALKGTWVVVSAERDGNKLSDGQIEGVRFTIEETGRAVVRKGEEVIFEGTLKIDPSKTPKTEDATQTSEGENKGRTVLSIYELKGEQLEDLFRRRAGKGSADGLLLKAGQRSFSSSFQAGIADRTESKRHLHSPKANQT